MKRITTLLCLLASVAMADPRAMLIPYWQTIPASGISGWQPSFLDSVVVWSDFSSAASTTIATHADTYITNLVSVPEGSVLYRERRLACSVNGVITTPITNVAGNSVGLLSVSNGLIVPGTIGTVAYTQPALTGSNQTVAAWFYPTAYNGATAYYLQLYANDTHHVEFRYVDTNQFRIIADVSGTTFPASNTNNMWMHLAMIWTPTNAYIYKNASCIFTQALVSARTNVSARMGSNVDGQSYVYGYVDSAFLVNSNIGASGVAELYGRGDPSTRTGE